jgi:drug/metabolite transporter (DMT)-like permease
MSEVPFSVTAAPRRHPRAAYVMAASAASLWAVNGTVSKVLLASGFSSLRLAEVRATGALVGLGAIVVLRTPGRLRARPRELLLLAVFGVLGLAFVQWFYFLAIHRLAIGVALLIQYVAPLLVAVWTRIVLKRPLRRRIWVALVLALAGLAFVLDVRSGGTLSTAGIAFSALTAVAYALYLLLAEYALPTRDPISLLAFGFGFAAAFFALIAPWWSFPSHLATRRVSLLGHLAGQHLPAWALIAWVIVAGTIVPFILLVNALRYLPATRVGIVAMLEPVVATVVAWAWLGESLGAARLAGGAVVLVAIALAQTAR